MLGHNPTNELMKTHPEYEVMDLTDSEVSDMQQPVEFQYRGDDLQFPAHLFAQITLEWVEHMQGDIDGMDILR